MPAVNVVDAAEVKPRVSPAAVSACGRRWGLRPVSTRSQQAVLECAPGQRAAISVPGDVEETLFVLEGEGRLHIPGEAHELEPEVGIYLPPGSTFELENPGAGHAAPRRGPRSRPQPGPPTPGQPSRRLERPGAWSRPPPSASFGSSPTPATGLRSATHFVGYIPTERAPDHFHTYDEVIYVIDGEGVMHAGSFSQPGAGGLLHPASRPDGALPVELGRRADADRRRLQTRGISGCRLLSGRNPRISEQSGPTPGEELAL